MVNMISEDSMDLVEADLNNDEYIDVLDILLLINIILDNW